MWAAGRSHPEMSLAFGLMAAINRFHRLLRHAVARAPITAPSLAGVSPAAGEDPHSSWVAAQAPVRDAVA